MFFPGGGTQSFDIEGSIRESKFYPKSIVKILSEDPKMSEENINSLQNGTRFRKLFYL